MTAGSGKRSTSRKSAKVEHPDVSRDEFNEVRDTVADLGRTVAQVVEVSKGHAATLSKIETTMSAVGESLTRIAANQAEHRGQRGTIAMSTVWHALGAFAAGAALVAALIMFAIQAQSGPTSERLSQLEDDYDDHIRIEGHPQMVARVTALERVVTSNHLENEAQHRWMADVFRLQADWEQRTRGMDVPDGRYTPLQGIGEAVK